MPKTLPERGVDETPMSCPCGSADIRLQAERGFARSVYARYICSDCTVRHSFSIGKDHVTAEKLASDVWKKFIDNFRIFPS